MELLLRKYGYLLLFVGIVLEGEAFLLAGAFLAQRGYFSLATVSLVALAANTLSAQFYFMAARARGRKWFESRFGEGSRYKRVVHWTHRHGNWLILLSRFAIGFRIVIPAACGALGMPTTRFLILNLVAGVLWVAPTVFIGYYFGATLDSLVRELRDYAMPLLAIGLLLVAIILTVRQLRRIREVFQNLGWADLHAAIPFVIGFMAVTNIVSAVWPSSESVLGQLRSRLPLEVSQPSRMLMLFTGIALLQVTRNLARRKELAWHVAVISLSASLLLHAMSGFDLQNSLVAALLLAYLIYFRRRFNTRTDPASLRRGLMITPLLLLMVFFYAVTGFFAIHSQLFWPPDANPVSEAVRTGILILKPNVVPTTQYAQRFLTSVQAAGWIARLYILVLLLRPVILRDRLEAPREDVRRIFAAHGNDSLSVFAIMPDKHHLLVAGGEGLVGYTWKNSIALACGDPIAPPKRFSEAVQEYIDHCGRHGWTPCVYMAAEENREAYQSLRLLPAKIGEEAILDLTSFAPSEPAAGVPVRLYDRAEAEDPLIDEQLEEVSEDWLEKRHMREAGFTAGRFSLETVSSGPVFILGSRYRVEAFCAWLTYNQGKAVVLDLIRQRRHVTPEAVHALLLRSLSVLRERYLEAALPEGLLPREQIDSLNPRWRPRYLVYPRGANPGRINKAIAAIEKL